MLIPYPQESWDALGALSPHSAWGTLTLSLAQIGMFFRYVTAYAKADQMIQHAPVKELAGMLGHIIASLLHDTFPNGPKH